MEGQQQQQQQLRCQRHCGNWRWQQAGVTCDGQDPSMPGRTDEDNSKTRTNQINFETQLGNVLPSKNKRSNDIEQNCEIITNAPQACLGRTNQEQISNSVSSIEMKRDLKLSMSLSSYTTTIAVPTVDVLAREESCNLDIKDSISNIGWAIIVHDKFAVDQDTNTTSARLHNQNGHNAINKQPGINMERLGTVSHCGDNKYCSESLYHQKVLPSPEFTHKHTGIQRPTFLPLIDGLVALLSLYPPSTFLTSHPIIFCSFTKTLRTFLLTFLLLSNCFISGVSAADPLSQSNSEGSKDAYTSLGSSPLGLLVQRAAQSSKPLVHRSLGFASTLSTSRPSSVASSASRESVYPQAPRPSFLRSSRQFVSDGTSESPNMPHNSTISGNNYNSTSDNYNGPGVAGAAAAAAATTTDRPVRLPDSCEVSNIKCALRTGCGMALQRYMLDCADLISGHTNECEPYCKESLLILTSTPEGRALMDCVCSDDYCRETTARMEVCREQVVQARSLNGEYSCTLAHLVCSADTRCSTAISYYDKHCRRMFSGRSCSPRCNNSIAILQRQEKAAKLETCICDGTEPFECAEIKRNMARLCFHQVDEDDREKQEEETNEIDTTPVRGDKSGAAGGSSSHWGTMGRGCSSLVVAVTGLVIKYGLLGGR